MQHNRSVGRRAADCPAKAGTDRRGRGGNAEAHSRRTRFAFLSAILSDLRGKSCGLAAIAMQQPLEEEARAIINCHARTLHKSNVSLDLRDVSVMKPPVQQNTPIGTLLHGFADASKM